VAVPVLSNLYQNNPGQARKTTRRFLALSLALGLLLTIGIWTAAPLAVYLLGPAFEGSVIILRILSLVLIFKSGSFVMAASILATNQQAKRTLVQAVAAAFNIGANLMVAAWLGISGVAWVYVLTEVILLTGYAWIVWWTGK
jgi:O-antigen/teichoic acid export membrane protein